MSHQDDDETLRRVRRIESRVTQLMVALGLNPPAQKPIFRRGVLEVPSRHSSLNECVGSIPSDWSGPVKIVIGGELIAEIVVRGA